MRLGKASNRSGIPRHRQRWPFWFKRVINAPEDGMPQIRYPVYPGIFCACPERCIPRVQHLLQWIEILRPRYSITQHGLEGDLDKNIQRTERKEGKAEERSIPAAEYAQAIRERDRESRHRLEETTMMQG